MSSSDEADEKTTALGLKRPKIASRACDRCRRKKIRCDAADKPGMRCTSCSISKLDCTFFERSGKRGPPKGYIRDLERRCAALEKLLARVAPHINILEEIGPSFNQHTWSEAKMTAQIPVARASTDGKDTILSSSATLPPSPTLDPYLYPHNAFGLPEDPALVGELSPSEMSNTEDERDQADSYIMKPLEEMMAQLNVNGFQRRFHGKSAGVYIVQTALALGDRKDEHSVPQISLESIRSRFWKAESWELATPHLPNPAKLVYPPEDLADELVDLTFKNVLAIFPLIHRPTFDAQRRAKLHLRNIAFARVYLLVCANGARYSEDDRTCFYEGDGKPQWGSAGWMYFSQVLNMRWPILAAATQSDLQVITMMALYIQSTSLSHASWLIGGIALRAALDIGLHRERVYAMESSFNAQMWRRIFWSLITFDRITSASFGRLVMINDEDIDAEPPLEVDDEYYDEERKVWKQPEGKVANISGFIQHLKLMGILCRSLRSFFSINKHKERHGYVGEEWESRIVADLDSDLNSWLNSLPDHLKWNTKIQDETTFHQSAYLRLMYYWTQTTIHRPFIPSISVSGKVSPLSLPSLAICTNAARAASRVVEEYGNRGFVDGPMIGLTHNLAGVLVICIHAVKKGGRTVDLPKLTEDIKRFTSYLHKMEKRWYLAGKFYDIMRALAKLHNIIIPNSDDESDSPAASDHSQTVTLFADTASGSLFAASATPPSDYTDISSGIQYPLPVPNHMNPIQFQRQYLFSPGPTPNAVLPPMSYPQQNLFAQWHAHPEDGTAAYAAPASANPFPQLGRPPYLQSAFPHTAPSDGLFQEFLRLMGPANAPQSAEIDAQYTDLFKSQSADDWNWFNQMVSGDTTSAPPLP